MGGAVERAKTFNPVAVIKVLEASKSDPYETSLGKVWYRAEDHQLVRPVPVVIGKAPGAMQNPDDSSTWWTWYPARPLLPADRRNRLPHGRL